MAAALGGALARLAASILPLIKALDQFDWNWPKKIKRPQVQHPFGLGFLKKNATVMLVGGVGLGKSRLAIALGQAACLKGHSELFTTAVEAINALAAAQAQSRLKAELKKFHAPSVLVCDEPGHVPIDKKMPPVSSSRSSAVVTRRARPSSPAT